MLRFFLALALLCSLAASAEAPWEVGGRKQLFIDSRFIQRSENVTLTVNPAEKMGIAQNENGERVHGHISSVTEQDGKIRLFLGADRIDAFDSEDGLHFRNAGVSVGGGVFTTVWRDSHETDDAKRYKHFWLRLSDPNDKNVDGVYAGYSADGINFTEVGRVLPYYTDNPILTQWDERVGKYVIFTRALEINVQNQRRVARIETDDLLKPWPFTTSDQDILFLSPRNAQVVLEVDEEDGGFADMYYNGAVRYSEAQDVYLMFPTMFRHFLPNRQPYIVTPHPPNWEDFGALEVQVAVSRDGIAWTRPERIPYIKTGLADEWDRWYTVMGPGYVRRGNYLYQYFYSSGFGHDGAILREEYKEASEPLGGIGMVRQRLDGFVSADTDHKGGWLETPLLTFEGSRLRLNMDAGAMGTAFVEVRDEAGNAIPGFELGACDEIGGNTVDQAVYWNRNPDISSLQGKPIKLYLKMARTKLYSFQFTAE